MSVRKTFFICVLIWVVSGTMALADPMITNNDGSWSYWLSNGGSVTPTTTKPGVPEPPPPVEPEPDPVPQATYAPAEVSPVASIASVSTFASSSPTGGSIPLGERADAFLNFGTAPYPDANLMTTGTPQPWYTSPVVEKYFGGLEPNAQQRAEFTNAVLDHVKETFRLSGGLDPKITLDPSVPTSHTMSVVSGASYPGNDKAIGITNIGNNGFSFIDKLSYGDSLEQLEWAVAHNASHELMHAFGVGGHDDQTGQFLDAGTASWELLTNPATRFSDAAIADIREVNFGPNYGATSSALELDGDMELIATPVPEPTTWALWGLAASVLVIQGRRRQRRNAR